MEHIVKLDNYDLIKNVLEPLYKVKGLLFREFLSQEDKKQVKINTILNLVKEMDIQEISRELSKINPFLKFNGDEN